MTTTAASSTADALEALRSLGFDLSTPAPDVIRYKYVGAGKPPRAAAPLLNLVKRRKVEALVLLATPGPWNEVLGRDQLRAFWRRADAATPPGTWAGLPDEIRQQLQGELDAAYDAIDAAFREQSVAGLAVGLRLFQDTVLAAVATARVNDNPEGGTA